MTAAPVLIVHASVAVLRADWVLARYLHREAIGAFAMALFG
jgi:hypothetical protein